MEDKVTAFVRKSASHMNEENRCDMTSEAAAEVLEAASKLCGADGGILEALYSHIKIAIDNEEVGAAIQSAIGLYQLTCDEEIGNRAKTLVDAVEQADGEDDGSPSE